MKKIALFLLITIGATSAKAQLIVDNTVNAEDAVQTILLGEGVEAFNITFSGDANQVGSFNSANSNIPVTTGVVIASGDVNVAIGPNDEAGATLAGGNFGAGDPDLQQLIPGFTLNDAAILEFDFIATGDSVSFRYVWSSEEYPEFVNSSFNDVFGFFLSGPGINGPFSLNAINIALIPGTTQPVTIDNVNAGLNAQFYVDNMVNATYGFPAPPNPDLNATQMDGLTVALTAQAGGLQCGETYHIKIAVADAGDTAYDSCVFLEAGSFASNDVNITVTIPNTPPGFPANTLLEGCIDGFITIFRPDTQNNESIQLVIGGTAVADEHYEALPDIVEFPEGELTVDIPITTIYDGTQEGTVNLTVSYDYIDACGDEVEIEIELFILEYNPPVLDLPEELFLCGGEDVTVSAVPEDGFGPFQYTWSTGANSSTLNVTGGGPEEISVEVIDYCESVVADSFIVIIPDPLTFPNDVSICLGQTAELMPVGGAAPYTFTFDEDALSFETGVWTGVDQGFYTVDVIDNCGETGSFTIEVRVCDTTIPNIFSPNNDNVNDTFLIQGWEGFPNSRIEIYNRWGGLVFEDDNYRSNWRGDDLAEGVYYYIYYRSDGETFTGELQLVRTYRPNR